MKITSIFTAMVFASLMATPAVAAVNVALGATVTPQGAFGTAGWEGGDLAPFASVTDGVFLPAFTRWDQGTVWWGSSTPFSGNNYLIIDLGSVKQFNQLVLQADNNEAYSVDYWDGWSYVQAWTAPSVGSAGWAMQTRSSGLFSTLNSQYLRINAKSGDSFYSVSELQALAPVPEPEAYVFLGLGLLAIGVARRFKG